MMKMDIPSKIDNIITQRRQKLPLVQDMKKRLEQVNQVIKKLERVCIEAGSGKSESYGDLFKQHPEIAEELRVINTKAFNNCYADALQVLNQLENRFSRNEIHISFVGRARQGKSLMMQSISGLSGDIIPASDGADCTGAKSVITNKNDSEVSAVIDFYTVEEYREIVNKYLKEIFGDNKFQIISVDDISALPLNELGSQLDTSNAKKQALFQQLTKYIEHSKELVPLLGTQKKVPSMEIEKYVAQYSSADKTKKYYTYLAVKVANIMCKFPCEQCGKIMLVDTIGLGDTALDIRERMLETVSKDSDAIILMTRPDSKGQKLEQADIDIVTDISEKMSAEYTREMLFWILNKVSSGVGTNVDGLQEILQQLQRMKDFPAADFLIIDCFDRNDVEQHMLIPILDKLSEGLPKTDEYMIEIASNQINLLYQEYHAIAEKVGQAFSASIDQDTHREFDVEIQETYKKMTNNIRELYVSEPYGILRNQPCDELKSAVEQKLRNILTLIPDKDDVLKDLNDGSINQHNAYENLTDKIRLSVINDFLELNEVLHGLVLQMKKRITHCLADENQGRLKFLITVDPDDADAWLKEFIIYMENYPKYNIIVEALKKLLDFDLRMESFLIYRVRAHLDVIDISLISHGPALRGTLAEKDILANDIIFWLEHNLEIVYKEIKSELEPLYNYPNSALWAVVKDFYDRIVYARDSEIGVGTAWRYLYEDAISSVWESEYNGYQAKKGVSERWNTIVNEIRKYDNKSTFCFSN